MEIKEFIEKLEGLNFYLIVEDDRLVLEGDENKLSDKELESIKENADVIDYIKAHKAELIAYISKRDSYSLTKNGKDISSMYRLSGLQEGMLFHALYANDGSSYLEQFVCDLLKLDVASFEQSWNVLLRRHSILRSSFHYDEFSIPVQCVHREARIPFELIDCRDLTEAEQEARFRDYQSSDRDRGIDFKNAPLMRIGLLRMSEDRYRMLWTHHHILLDGWSLPVLMGELLEVYEDLVSGKAVAEVAEDRYEDYIRYIEGVDKQAEELYWHHYLEGLEGGTLLPFIARGSERNKGIGVYGEAHLSLGWEMSRAIEGYAQRNRLTVNTVIQGVWAYLLYRYTGNRHVTYGVTVSGRPDDLPGVEQRMGMYINTLPLHTAIDPEESISGWLQRIQSGQLQSREYQYTALNNIQRWSGISGDLFDSIVVFENYPVGKVLSSRAWSLQVENVQIQEQFNYPLGITVSSGEELRISFGYNTDLLDREVIERIRGHFSQVLEQLADNSKERLSELELLSTDEREQLLTTFNSTNVDYPREKTLADLFEEQVKRGPDAVAVVYEDTALSYGELNARANQLGRYLQSQGVQAETLVPICIERGLNMIVGILGILKAGGAYVPIDPEYPADRIAYMLEDTGSKQVLTSGLSRTVLPEQPSIQLIDLDELAERISQESGANLSHQSSARDLAYVIYTSGSTGKPKGVMIEHRSLVNYCLAFIDYYAISNEDKIIQQASIAFDTMAEEVYPALFAGAAIVIIEGGAKNVFSLKHYIENGLVTILSTTPLVIDWLNKELTTIGKLRCIISGGDVLLPEFVNRLHHLLEVVNTYGPTETTICVTYNRIEGIISTPLIGKPIANTEIYIQDAAGNLCPVGISGELCIGGAGLARGYLNRPELTAERFIRNPYSEEPGTRLYRTGDLARWLPDGNIEYQGRLDDQVKIRGYRIELGEIESVLGESDQVNHAVVLTRADRQGNKRLVAYVVPNGTFDRTGIQSYLAKKLPEYMVPQVLVEVDELPLTANGKIDRKALPDVDSAELSGSAYVAPLTETEQKLAEIWQELLGVESVSIHDNFFELGGHSLLAMRLVAAIASRFLLIISVRMIFELANIYDLGKYIELQSAPESEQEERQKEFDIMDI